MHGFFTRWKAAGVVERTFSWICRARRNVRDYERLPEHSEAFIHWSMITMMTRRMTRGKSQASNHLTGIKDRP